MGLKLKDIIVKKEVAISDLADRKLVVDSFNVMYQFLATIRTRDGSLLMDSKGNVTSHLTGMFSRTASLVGSGLRLAFVFDGKAPELKKKERERRKEAKKTAQREYEIAREREDIDAMKKYAARTAQLTPEMVEEAKKLIAALGMPVIQAPSEGEAQAAHIVRKGEAFAEVSQDFDCLMFGVPRLIRNLTVSERRKMPSRLSYEVVKPELIELDENLRALGVTQDQLIAVGILVGTDFNPGGIKGIGQKNVLKLVAKHGEDFDSLFNEVQWDKTFPFSWSEVFGLIKNMPVTDRYFLEWKQPDVDAVMKLLVGEHDFSEQRVSDTLAKMDKAQEQHTQKGLGDFL